MNERITLPSSPSLLNNNLCAFQNNLIYCHANRVRLEERQPVVDCLDLITDQTGDGLTCVQAVSLNAVTTSEFVAVATHVRLLV